MARRQVNSRWVSGPNKDRLLPKGLGTKHHNPAGRAGPSLPRLPPTVPKRGEPGRPRDHSQVQPRVHISRQVHGNEESPRSSRKGKWQVRGPDQCGLNSLSSFSCSLQKLKFQLMRPSVTFLNVWFLPQSYPNLLNRNKTQSKSFLNSKGKIQRFSFQLWHSSKDLSESLRLPSSKDKWALDTYPFFFNSPQCMPLSVNGPLLLSCVRLPAQWQILKGF